MSIVSRVRNPGSGVNTICEATTLVPIGDSGMAQPANYFWMALMHVGRGSPGRISFGT